MPPIDRLLSQYSAPVKSWPGEEDADAEALANWRAANPERKLQRPDEVWRGAVLPIAEVRDKGSANPADWRSSSDVLKHLDQGSRWAVPGMVQDVFDAAQAIYDSSGLGLGPATRFSTLPEAERERIAELGVAGATAGITGGLTRAAVAPRLPAGTTELGIFGGRSAKTANLDALARAEEMLRVGRPREEIWSQTGWFQGPDQKWRFEIDDSASSLRTPEQAAALKNEMLGERARLLAQVKDSLAQEKVQPDLFPKTVKAARSDMRQQAKALNEKVHENYGLTWHPQYGGWRAEYAFDHDPLFSAYPEIGRHVIVRQGDHSTSRGSFNHENKSLDIYSSVPKAEQYSTGLHELQHAVQGNEGFARGSNPDAIHQDMVAARASIETADQNIADAKMSLMLARRDNPDAVPELEARIKSLTEWRASLVDRATGDAFDRYKRHAGEVEARAVQARRDLTPEERRARPPWLDYDVPESDQIVRFGSGSGSGAMSVGADPWPKIKSFDAQLPRDFARAVDEWVGGPHDAMARGIEGGLMMPQRLEQFPVDQLRAGSQPVRDILRDTYGDYVTVYRGDSGGNPSTGRQGVLNSYTTDRSVAERFAGARTPEMKLISGDEVLAAQAALDQRGEAHMGGKVYRREADGSIGIYDRDGNLVTDTDSLASEAASYNEFASRLNADRAEALGRVREVRIPVQDVVWATDRFGQKEIIAPAASELSSSPNIMASIDPLSMAMERGPRRSIDPLGYYSPTLDAALRLAQKKGTPEQMLAQLKKAGAKDSEIEVSGLKKMFEGKKSVSQEEIVKALEDGKIGLNEVVYSRGKEFDGELQRRLEDWRDETRASGRFQEETNRRKQGKFFESDANIEKMLPELQAHGVAMDYAAIADNAWNAIGEFEKAGIKVTQGKIGVWSDHNGNFYVIEAPDGTAWMMADHDMAPTRYASKAQAIADAEDSAMGDNVRDLLMDENDVAARLREEIDPDDPTRYSNYSLDPENPTYREVVLHLPPDARAARSAWEAANPGKSWDSLSDADRSYLSRKHGGAEFQSGHFDEPNIVGHMMVSETRLPGDPNARVLTLDQVQSDWGQKLRDGGVRDEAKIAGLQRQIAEGEAVDLAKAQAERDAIRSVEDQFGIKLVPGAAWENLQSGQLIRNYLKQVPLKYEPDVISAVTPIMHRLGAAPEQDLRLLRAELSTAMAATPGHPLVNTTDQWLNTTLRRAIRMAAQEGQDYIAIPSGNTVLGYNPGQEKGMLGFYGGIPKNDMAMVSTMRQLREKAAQSPNEPIINTLGPRAIDALARVGILDKKKIEGISTARVLKNAESRFQGIVPKNLGALLQKLDKNTPPPKVIETLDSPSGKTGLGQGFTLFRITPEAKKAVMEGGQPLFRCGGRVR